MSDDKQKGYQDGYQDGLNGKTTSLGEHIMRDILPGNRDYEQAYDKGNADGLKQKDRR
jgi:hypothetical protein